MKAFVVAGAMCMATLPAAAATYAIENVALSPDSLRVSFPTTTITVGSAAVQRGHFAIHAHTGPVGITGDIGDFVSFVTNGSVLDGSGYGSYYSLTIDLSFASDGEVTAARLDYEGLSPSIVLNGTGTLVTGNYFPFDGPCGFTGTCRVLSGQVMQVPEPYPVSEPGAIAILLVSLGELLLYRACPRRPSRPKRTLLTTV